MTAPDGWPSRRWVDRFMRLTLPFGILYAIWIALELVQIASGGEPLTGLVAIRLLISGGTAFCLIAGGVVWRRDRTGGA